MATETELFWTQGDLNNKDMGSMIKLIREDHLKLTQEELAEKMQTSVKNIKMTESGGGIMAPKILKTIGELYNLEVSVKVSEKIPADEGNLDN